MSVVTEKLLFCDGNEGCPEDGPYGCADGRNDPGYVQRESAKKAGWVYRNGKDYCPACANRLFAHEYVYGGSSG